MALGELGRLVVSLEANIAQFIAAMGRAEAESRRRTEAINSAMGKASKAANMFAKSLVVGLVSGGIVAGTRNVLNAADQVQKLGQRLGVSTEALSEYKHVADLSGVSFNTLTMGWQRMTRRVAEAAQGTGEAKNALKELGVSATELNKLAPDKQFELLADAIMGVKNPADQVRLAMKLFDSEGVALLQTMQGGSAAMRETRAEAVKLGLSIGQDAANAAAQFNDNMSRVSKSISGLFQQLVLQLGPALADIAGWLANKLPEAFNQLNVWIVKARSGFSTMVAAMLEGAAKVADALAFITFGDTSESFKQRAREFRTAAKEFEIMARDYRREAEALKTKTYEFNTSAKTTTATVEKFGKATGEAAKKQKELKNGIKDNSEAIEAWNRALEQGSKNWDEYARAQFRYEGITDDNTEATKDLDKATKDLEKTQESLWRTTDEIARGAIRGIFDAWGDMWRNLITGSIDSFGDFIDALKTAFLNMIAELLAAWTGKFLLQIFGGLPIIGDILGGLGIKVPGGDILTSIGGSAAGSKIAGWLGFGGSGGGTAATTYGTGAAGGAIYGTAIGGATLTSGGGGGAGAFLTSGAGGGAAAPAGFSAAQAVPYVAAAYFGYNFLKTVFGGSLSPEEKFAKSLKENYAKLGADAAGIFLENWQMSYDADGDAIAHEATDLYAILKTDATTAGAEIARVFTETNQLIVGDTGLAVGQIKVEHAEAVKAILQYYSGELQPNFKEVLRNLDTSSEQFARAFRDGILSASEAAAFGLQIFGDLGAEALRKLMEWAGASADAIRAIPTDINIKVNSVSGAIGNAINNALTGTSSSTTSNTTDLAALQARADAIGGEVVRDFGGGYYIETGFQHGGQFTVPHTLGQLDRPVTLGLRGGEHVQVTTPEENRGLLFNSVGRDQLNALLEAVGLLRDIARDMRRATEGA